MKLKLYFKGADGESKTITENHAADTNTADTVEAPARALAVAYGMTAVKVTKVEETELWKNAEA